MKFKGKYREKLLSGRKKSTIRRGTSLRPGDKVIIESGEESLGEALIKEVSDVRVEELTDEHAREDGFSNLKELLEELSSIYGSRILRKGTKLKLIKFDMESKQG